MKKRCLGCGENLGDDRELHFCGGCWNKIPENLMTEIYKSRAKLRKDGSEESRARLEKALRAAAEAVRS